jgi:hypothetical protein
MIDPASSGQQWTYGCRFVAFPWFKSITNNSEDILVTESIFTNHVTFGLASEFIDSIKIKDIDDNKTIHFKLGVGLVVRPSNNRFNDVPFISMENSEN